MSDARVLVVDDEPQIGRVLRTALQAQGFEVMTASNGETALDRLASSSIDLVILDLGLPGIDGHEVIRRVRTWSDVPIVVLSVRENHSDKVGALDAGADDYVTKPFVIEELLARVRAVRRRAAGEPTPPVLRFGPLLIDLGRRLVLLAGSPVHLTKKEYALLELLATNPGKLLTHGWLLDRVWGPGYSKESHYLGVFIQQLRQKLGDDAAQPTWIATEFGLGYRWVAEPDGR